MYILCGCTYSEICIVNSVAGFREMGDIMLSFDKYAKFQSSDTSIFSGELSFLDEILLLKPDDNKLGDSLKISILNKSLIFTGNKIAMQQIGQSLLAFFDDSSQEGEHIHFNYDEDDFCITSPHDFKLVLMYKASRVGTAHEPNPS